MNIEYLAEDQNKLMKQMRKKNQNQLQFHPATEYTSEAEQYASQM